MYIFDERIQTLLQRSSSVGIDLPRHYRNGTVRISQIDPAELSPGEFSYYVQREVEDGVLMTVIDSLNGYSYAMPEERFLTVYLYELSSYLNQQKVTSIYTVAQRPPLAESSSSLFEVSYIADTVVQHRFVEIRGRNTKALSVYKRRSGPHETGTYEIAISERGLSVGEPISYEHSG
jgi:circadian clock protein KaiC